MEADELYIRSVCFSPNGKSLATSAEKQIKVRVLSLLDLSFSPAVLMRMAALSTLGVFPAS